MKCPFCQSDNTQVKDSRPAEDNTVVRRRRHCGACQKRFTTFERIQLRELVVVKRGGVKEPFVRDKIARSMHIALRKRDFESETIEKLSSDIVRQLESGGESEIPVQTIGEAVMDALLKIDKVAYIRFASVYKDFKEIGDFDAFIKSAVEDGKKQP